MKYIILSLISVFAFSAQAKGIGQAGCGLGNQILGSEPGAIQIVGATTNGFYGNQTFGITSGTSNCVDGAMGAALENFIEANQVALNNDISRGNGETVATMNRMLSCANGDVANRALKNSYEQISSQKTAGEMATVIKQTLRQEPKAGCQSV